MVSPVSEHLHSPVIESIFADDYEINPLQLRGKPARCVRFLDDVRFLLNNRVLRTTFGLKSGTVVHAVRVEPRSAP